MALAIYPLIAKFPQHEQYALSSQIKRAVISIPSNVAEGSGRASMKEKNHFLEIAFGSLTETYCQLLIATELGYIAADELESVQPLFKEVARQISGLRNSYSPKP
ncbi:MAG: four helix bundle protein [Bacteroidales bacterium]|nr:four helix bundle protein [Bacteroidales bacterium]